ncbi:MAG TPA: hypothetical protein VGM86_31435 [Thermoanaerobaculia bacterium]|jgi:hypothetical protein
MRKGTVLLLLLLSGCAAVTRPGSPPRKGAPDRPAQQPISPGQPVAQTQRFSLYSDPWINLHHFLYQWAAAAQQEEGPKSDLPAVEVPERAELPQLAADERQAWTNAVDYYRREIIARDLLFDAGLIAAKEKLSQAAATGRASLAGLPPQWRDVLEGAMRVYEKRWWPRHDRVNRAWIQSLSPQLQTYEGTLTAGLARAFGGTLPAQRVRLDAAAYSHRVGAYTTVHPDQTIVATSNPALQGFNALEIVIHEFSHLDELEPPVRDLEARAFAQSHVPAPRDFWHAVIFYTACDLTREALHAHGIDYQQCVADRVDLLGRTPRWKPYWKAFDASWKPFLEGRTDDRETAAAEVARDLVQSSAKPRQSGHG